jgi:hypothetical protein
LLRKGGEEMATNKSRAHLREQASKGNIFNFFEDAANDPKLQKRMLDVIKTKGKGLSGEELLKKFQRLHYDGVSLRDCNRILLILKGIKDPSTWDWSY